MAQDGGGERFVNIPDMAHFCCCGAGFVLGNQGLSAMACESGK